MSNAPRIHRARKKNLNDLELGQLTPAAWQTVARIVQHGQGPAPGQGAHCCIGGGNGSTANPYEYDELDLSANGLHKLDPSTWEELLSAVENNDGLDSLILALNRPHSISRTTWGLMSRMLTNGALLSIDLRADCCVGAGDTSTLVDAEVWRLVE